MSPQVTTIDYDKLVSTYWESLVTVLRGFSAQPGTEFLDAWVPDHDDASSILGIIEAARAGALKSITIGIGAVTVGKMNLPALVAEAARYGRAQAVPSADGVDLRVALSGEQPEVPQAPAARPAQIDATSRQSSSRRAVAVVPQPAVVPADGALPEAYVRALNEVVPSLTHEGVLQAEAGADHLRSGAAEPGLDLLVGAEESVRAARHHGGRSVTERKLLDLLCRRLEGRPLQEGQDHAVVHVEYELRSRSQARLVRGISLPANASAVFGAVQELLDAAAALYRQRGHARTRNAFEPPASAEWRVLSDRDRLARIQHAVDAHPAGAGLRVVKLESLQRFVLGAVEGATGEVTGSRLRELEAHVKRTVEPTLYLEMGPRVDLHKLRRLNDKGIPTS